MNIRRGSSRIVIALPLLGIVIKFPIIKIKEMIIGSFAVYKSGGYRALRRQFSYPTMSYGSARRSLFYGIKQNWEEFCIYVKTRNRLLAPSYFSLLGLVNVSRYVPEVPGLDCFTLVRQLSQLTDHQFFKSDPHHFEDTGNFGIWNGKIVMRDYGSAKLVKFIVDYGDIVHDNFKF